MSALSLCLRLLAPSLLTHTSNLVHVTNSLQIQFDNRGSKVEGAKDKLVTSVAKMLGVPAKNVEMKVTGQSSLLNHQVCVCVW